MQQNTWVQLMAMRGKDAQAIILPYVLSVLGVFTFIIWGGETADTGAVQLAIAAWVVLGSLWTLLWFDGVLADVGAGMQDMDSNMGKNFAKAPFAIFRGFNALVIVIMAVLQISALYA